jgi:hypothetical protein
MATTTPNYGWTVPTSTDLVKDGATAIETLGDAIDASMNTALGTKKAGMVLLNTTSFSAVASQSINNVFSSTYSNYRITCNSFNNSSAGISDIRLRLRAGGVDSTGATDYRWHNFRIYSTGTSANTGSAGEAYIRLFASSTGANGAFSFDILNPNALLTTQLFGQSYSYQSDITTVIAGSLFGYEATANAYDGFTIYPSANNISGVISVYGYNR